jgi:hypothetical protein
VEVKNLAQSTFKFDVLIRMTLQVQGPQVQNLLQEQSTSVTLGSSAKEYKWKYKQNEGFYTPSDILETVFVIFHCYWTANFTSTCKHHFTSADKIFCCPKQIRFLTNFKLS